jgi:NADH:ubiquinone oxidoreductase subunit 6 (subunit J)
MLPVFGADPPASGLLSALLGLAALWPIWLPLAAGALAVYWLLPRPRAYPWAWGALAGAAALVLAGWLLVRTGAVTAEVVLFYAFSGIAIVAGALLVTQHNPARAALSFALVVLSTTGLFLLLAAPFLMAATIIVYAGAIIVTFLFVLMLAQQEGLSDADDRSREPLLSTLTGFVLLGAVLYVLKLGYDTRELDRLLARTREAIQEEDLATMRALVAGTDDEDKGGKPGEEVPDQNKDLYSQSMRVLGAHGWKDLQKQAEDLIFLEDPFANLEGQRKQLQKLEALLQEGLERVGTVRPPANAPLSAMSGTPANAPAGEIRRNPNTRLPRMPADNSSWLGRSLYTDFLLPVELGGLLLLVAAVGAIAIGHRRDRPGAPPGDSKPKGVV